MSPVLWFTGWRLLRQMPTHKRVHFWKLAEFRKRWLTQIILIRSLPPDPSNHEFRGPVGGPGVCPGQRAVPRPQSCHPLWLHRRHCCETARWLPAVLAIPRALWQAGGPTVPRESGEKIKKKTTTTTTRASLEEKFNVLVCSALTLLLLGGHGNQRRTSRSPHEAWGERRGVFCARNRKWSGND